VSANAAVADDPVRQWRSSDLARLVPGTKAYAWRIRLAPQLVSVGVLRRVGRLWFGRASAIERALLGQIAPGAPVAPNPDDESRKDSRPLGG